MAIYGGTVDMRNYILIKGAADSNGNILTATNATHLPLDYAQEPQLCE